jgi:hypothetical protein
LFLENIMADEADRAADMQEMYEADQRHTAGIAASKIPVGAPGECEICGTASLRLVSRNYRNVPTLACATCRDHFKLG